LWAPLPAATVRRFYNETEEGLQALWSQKYKNREIPDEPQIPAGYYGSAMERKMRWAAASQSAASQSQHSLRSRGQQQPMPEALIDELERYLRGPNEDPGLFDNDPTRWWRDVGAKRFPRLSFLASDLLSIPSSTAGVEKEFNGVRSIITPKRNRLGRNTVCQAQSLRVWRRQYVYRASEEWEQTLPL
jgi:hypothetical protein